MHFSIFLRNILKIYENSPAPGGLPLPQPVRGRPLKVFPRTEILAAPLEDTVLIIPSHKFLEPNNMNYIIQV